MTEVTLGTIDLLLGTRTEAAGTATLCLKLFCPQSIAPWTIGLRIHLSSVTSGYHNCTVIVAFTSATSGVGDDWPRNSEDSVINTIEISIA